MAEPLGVGVQTLWTGGRPDFDPRWRRVSGGLAVAHSVARMVVCPPGRLSWAPHIGGNVLDLLNDGFTTQRVRAFAGYLRGLARSDARVKDTTVTVELLEQTLKIRIEITTSDDEVFALVLSASKLTIDVLAIEKVR